MVARKSKNRHKPQEAPQWTFENQSGSTILMAVVGIAMVSMVSLAYIDIYSSTRQIQGKVNFFNTISQIQLNITNTVNDANSFAATLADSAHNSNMSCISNRNCTTAISSTGFVLWPAGTTNYSYLAQSLYDGTSPSAGYTLSGQTCSTFSMSGNSSCPIHVNLAWSTPGCAPAPCSAAVIMTANILYRPGTDSQFGSIDESQLALSFVQKSTSLAIPCSGAPPAPDAALCSSPPYPEYRLLCTATGFKCGQVYY